MKWVMVKIDNCKRCPNYSEHWDRELWRTVRLCRLLPDQEIKLKKDLGVIREAQSHIPIPKQCPLEETEII